MTDPTQAQTVVATKDIVTWVVTGIGLSLNFGWNLWNHRRTTGMANGLRKDAFDLDEWKSHRAAITSRLDDFENAGDRLLALTRGEHEALALLNELNSEGRILVSAHEALLRSLERYGSQNWALLAYGKSTNGESDWDQLNSILAGCSELGDDASTIRASLHPMKTHLRSIAGGITERITSQTEQHYPR